MDAMARGAEQNVRPEVRNDIRRALADKIRQESDVPDVQRLLEYKTISGISRLARLNRADAVVVLFCGSKKSLASGLPMALVFFGTGAVGLIMLPLMIFHQIQLFVCAVIASRMSRTDAPERTEA